MSHHSNDDLEYISCKIIEIKEYTNTYSFLGIKNNLDTVLIVSLKENDYDLNGCCVQLDSIYFFKLIPLKLRIPMQAQFQFEASIIFCQDIIYRASKVEELPVSYISENIKGLMPQKNIYKKMSF